MRLLPPRRARAATLEADPLPETALSPTPVSDAPGESAAPADEPTLAPQKILALPEATAMLFMRPGQPHEPVAVPQVLLAPGEVLVAVVIPASGFAGVSRFLKLGARAHLVISIAMVAVRLVVREGRVAEACVAVGACSPVAVRLAAVERALEGVALGEATGVDVDVSALAPLDDIRATSGYRREAAAELVRRAVAEVVACC